VTEKQDRPVPHQAWLRGLNERRISRRDLLRGAGAGAGAMGLSALLAACGVSGTQQNRPSARPSSPSPLPPKAGTLRVANWPLYIDDKTVKDFEKATGIQTTYKDDIGDNDEFFATDVSPQISAGEPTGWDIITMTDWMIEKLIRLGYVQPLHPEAIPNAVNNLDDKFRDPWFDPGNAYSYPWAVGVTGIGVNRKFVDREITSINDLFDPAFEQHVGMFLEMRDSVNFALLLLGHDPVNATEAQIDEAFTKLEQQKADGIVRDYFDNSYIGPFNRGDLWVTMAWSGDVNYLKLDNPDLEFVIPEEGGNRWSDNMVIPVLTEHPTDAHEWINYVYDVEHATQICEFVWYESAVAGVHEAVIEDAKEDSSLKPVAESDLVWPTAEILANLHQYKRLSEEEERVWHDRWDPLIQG
jgi:spermidine/putrescine transport system substrate-binding protein